MARQFGSIPCDICGGQKLVGGHVVDPALRIVAPIQLCPMCNGTGVMPDPGLQFGYEFVFNLTANQALTGQSLLIQDRDFKWIFFTGFSTGAFQVMIKDGGSGKRPFMNQQVHSTSILGNGQNPHPLLSPWVFNKQGSIVIDITDLSGANNNVRLFFEGVEASQ